MAEQLKRWFSKTRMGMTKVIDGVYVGSRFDCQIDQLQNNRITHILRVHERQDAVIPGFTYLTISLSDNTQTNIREHFTTANNFIHNARRCNGRVLVHCLAGCSRSVSFVVAYLMSASDCGWEQCLDLVCHLRATANPNAGFREQLREFEQTEAVDKERERMAELFGEDAASRRLLSDQIANNRRRFMAPRLVTDMTERNEADCNTNELFGNESRPNLAAHFDPQLLNLKHIDA